MRTRRVLATLATATGLVLGLAAPALAHARAMATSPGAGSTVRGMLTKVSVTFDEAVTLVPHALRMTTDRGIPVALEAAQLNGDHTVLSARVQDHLATGRYAVAWRVQADDGHLESSTFSFAVAAAGAQSSDHAAATPLSPPPNPDEPLWPVLVAAALAMAGGVGAGVAVRRGLRVAAMRDYSDVHGESPRDHETLRLPM